MSSTRPSFQFYPGDWLTNPKLRACTLAQRGAWMSILCALHESDTYGFVHLPLTKLATISQISVHFLRILFEKNVLKGAHEKFEGFSYTPRVGNRAGDPVLLIPPCDGPCWYSSRLVVDEWRRGRHGTGTRFTSENQPHIRVPIRREGTPDEPYLSDGKVTGLLLPLLLSTNKEDSSERVEKTDRAVGANKCAPGVQTPVDNSPVRRKKGTRWNDGQAVPRGWIDAARDKRIAHGLPDLDLDLEAECFVNYWTAKAGAAAAKLDWYATWINWAISEKTKPRVNGHGHGKPSPHEALMQSGARVLEQLRQRDKLKGTGS